MPWRSNQNKTFDLPLIGPISIILFQANSFAGTPEYTASASSVSFFYKALIPPQRVLRWPCGTLFSYYRIIRRYRTPVAPRDRSQYSFSFVTILVFHGATFMSLRFTSIWSICVLPTRSPFQRTSCTQSAPAISAAIALATAKPRSQ